jgi:hypothetical protein
MKSLNDYIVEKQQINEAGLRDTLFGEIVMKLLGTGLDWIKGSASWVADTLKQGFAGAWGHAKNLNEKAWENVFTRWHYKGDIPTNEQTMAKVVKENILVHQKMQDRIKACDDFYEACVAAGNDNDSALAMYINYCIMSIIPAMTEDGTSDEEKNIGKKKLDELKKKYPKIYKEEYNKFKKQFKKDNKKTNKK